MDARCSIQPLKGGKKSFRLLGFPAGIGLIVALAFALAGSAGAGTARIAVAPSNTSPPTIAGTVQQGQTVTADKGTWSGTDPITYTYEWLRCHSSGDRCSTLSGVTGTTYLLGSQDVNHTLRVAVTAKNADGVSSVTSLATEAAKASTTVEPTNTALPVITGTVQEGQTLTASTGTWSGATPITYSYSWSACDMSGGRCSNIGAANNATYTVQKQDIDNTLRVVVTAKNTAGSNSATSAQTAAVKAIAIPAAVSLSLSTSTVVFKNPLTLSGTISSKQAGESVQIQQQRFGFADASFSPLATVTTTTDGAWTLITRPTVHTSYQANWNDAASLTRTVGVHPLVTFHVIVGNRFSTKVVASHSFATRIVQFQRRSSQGQWVTLKRVHLNATSNATFPATLPKGTSSLRIAFSINQAGPGYLGGMSRTIVYHRG